jgi:hypothetical protein
VMRNENITLGVVKRNNAHVVAWDAAIAIASRTYLYDLWLTPARLIIDVKAHVSSHATVLLFAFLCGRPSLFGGQPLQSKRGATKHGQLRTHQLTRGQTRRLVKGPPQSRPPAPHLAACDFPL